KGYFGFDILGAIPFHRPTKWVQYTGIIPAWCGYYFSIHLHFIPEMFAIKSTFRLFNSCCSGFVQVVVQARNSD
ncbi:hypothetical protein, partial [Escherichia coli]|uniref:hypothetical protein n=1 Tax=Escherichia coli TaxID=562 RepID=UPI0019624503